MIYGCVSCYSCAPVLNQGEPLPAFPNGGRCDKLGSGIRKRRHCLQSRCQIQIESVPILREGLRVPSDSVIRATTLNKGKESYHNLLVLQPRPLNTPSTAYEELQKILKQGTLWKMPTPRCLNPD